MGIKQRQYCVLFINIYGDEEVKSSLIEHIMKYWRTLSWKETADFEIDCDCETQFTAKWGVEDLWTGENYEIPRYDWVNKVGLYEELRLNICNCGAHSPYLELFPKEELLIITTDII